MIADPTVCIRLTAINIDHVWKSIVVQQETWLRDIEAAMVNFACNAVKRQNISPREGP